MARSQSIQSRPENWGGPNAPFLGQLCGQRRQEFFRMILLHLVAQRAALAESNRVAHWALPAVVQCLRGNQQSNRPADAIARGIFPVACRRVSRLDLSWVEYQ